MQKKELYVVPVPVLDTYALTVCALLTALSVVLARVLTLIPAARLNLLNPLFPIRVNI